MKIHKIRNVAIVLGIFGLLSGSLYMDSHALAKKRLYGDIRQSSNIFGQTILSSMESNSSTVKQQSATRNSTSSDSPSSSSSTSNTSTPSSPPTSQPNTTSSSSGENSSILAQVQNSVHNKLYLRAEGIVCQLCHMMKDDSYPLQRKGWESCGSCHVNSTSSPTLGYEVQHPQFQMIQGVALGDILPMPSYKYKYMRDTFSCTDCHLTNASKHDFMVPGATVKNDSQGNNQSSTEMDYQAFRIIFNQDKCAVCHPSSAAMVERVKNEQDIISKRLTELKPTYDEWSKKVTSMNPEDPKVLAFKNGATYYTFVDSDGSKGVHNFPYAQALLDKAEIYWNTLTQ